MVGKKKKAGSGIDGEEVAPSPKSGKGKAMVLGAALVLVGGLGQRFLLAGSPAEVIIAPPVQADGAKLAASGSAVDCSQFESAAAGASAPHARRYRAEGSTAGGSSDLASMTINLADGRFLKVGISVELGPSTTADQFKTQQAKAADVALRFFATKTVAQLTNDKHEAIKAELTCKLQAVYGQQEGKQVVTGVLFREFLTS